MTREYLLRLTYLSDYCPDCNCQSTTIEQCQECCNKALIEYENKIYNKALDDCIKSMREESCEWEYQIAFIESCKKER